MTNQTTKDQKIDKASALTGAIAIILVPVITAAGMFLDAFIFTLLKWQTIKQNAH